LWGLRSPEAAAQDLDFSFELLNDTRFDVARLWDAVPDDDGVGSELREAGEPGFARNETSLRFQTRVSPHHRVRFVGDVELIWLNLSERRLGLSELTTRQAVDPWRLECDAAYIDLRDLLPGLDLRLGRQIVKWGAADMFNPTDNINADDLEDRILFGENMANEMIRLDYTIVPDDDSWLGDVIFTLVWVPVFRPAQLPRSATLPLADTSAEVPVLEPDVRSQINNFRSLVASQLNDPTVEAELPEFSLNNSQVGIRVQARMGETDFSLSYYRGFDDIPVMTRTDAVMVPVEEGPVLFDSNVVLGYPRMQVLGFDINGQLPFLGHLGYWLEGAVIFPEELGLVFAFGEVPGLFSDGLEIPGTAVDDRPFLKLTAGVDYSFNEHVFMNIQYVRGFINEFGASALNNFLVAGVDLKFWSERILVRCFGLLQLDWIPGAFRGRPRESWEDGLSANLFPMVRVSPWGATALEVGGIIPLGSSDSYFGQPATGATTIFLRVHAAF
jgi:hypothetical protein